MAIVEAWKRLEYGALASHDGKGLLSRINGQKQCLVKTNAEGRNAGLTLAMSRGQLIQTSFPANLVEKVRISTSLSK